MTPGSAGQGGFSCTSPGSSLLSSTSPLFMPLPPRMPNLAHAICRLSSEIGTGTKAECITCITSPPLPLHEEREGRRAGGQAANLQLSFLSSCSLLPPQSQGVGASGSSQAGPRGRTRAPILERPQGQGRSDRVAVPWLGGTGAAGSPSSGRSVVASPGDLGQVLPPHALCRSTSVWRTVGHSRSW